MVLFEDSAFPISVYGIIIAVAILAAFVTVILLFRYLGWRDDLPYLILLLAVPCGIVGARIFYVFFSDWSMYQSFFDVINLRRGGLAIYGAVIGGAAGLYAVCRWKKVGFMALADVIVIGLIFAQGIGRWGNFVNNEAYGFAVDNHVPPFTVLIYGTPHLATFFYESIMNFIGFGVMLFLFLYLRKTGKYKTGTILAVYLIWYGVTRAIIEPLRTDSLLIIGSANEFILNRVSFVLSLAIIIAGVVLLYIARTKSLFMEEKCLITTKTDTSEGSSPNSTQS